MLVAATFFLALTAAFSFGILAGYGVVTGILYAFARNRRPPEPPPTAVLSAADAHD